MGSTTRSTTAGERAHRLGQVGHHRQPRSLASGGEPHAACWVSLFSSLERASRACRTCISHAGLAFRHARPVAPQRAIPPPPASSHWHQQRHSNADPRVRPQPASAARPPASRWPGCPPSRRRRRRRRSWAGRRPQVPRAARPAAVAEPVVQGQAVARRRLPERARARHGHPVPGLRVGRLQHAPGRGPARAERRHRARQGGGRPRVLPEFVWRAGRAQPRTQVGALTSPRRARRREACTP